MLQDTSFAIHPGNKQKIENSDYIDVGAMLSYSQNGQELVATCENGYVLVRYINDEIVRIVLNPKEPKFYNKSRAVENIDTAVDTTIEEQESQIIFKSSKLQITITKSPVRINAYDLNGRPIVVESGKGMGYKNSGEVISYKQMGEDDHFYGFGEKTGFLNKRGEKITMWNTDVYAPHNPETIALYQSIPFFINFTEGLAYGLFLDNPSKTVFDLQSENDRFSFLADCGLLDYYIFAGPTIKEVIQQYTSLTGRAPIPPKWSLGYHQSRYSYETEEEVIELVRNFKEKGIPVDVIHLDIHYMDGYRVFTFDHDRFPNPKQLIEALKNEGVHVVPIVDPGVKEDPEYKIYQEGILSDLYCKYIEGNIYYGDVWPGNSAFPDFTNEETRQWWGDKHKYYTDLGVEGIWNDMNEPAVFNETKTMDVKVVHGNDGDPKTHRELHNHYGLLMSKATYEGMKKQLNGKRPFLLTRAGYSGVQKYAAVWTGDNRSFWEHLQMSLPMVMNLGLSGIPFAGPDVGGFAHDSNGELLARWTQVGAFTPFFRNHSAIGFARQEPWSFGEKYEAIVKKYIQLRYQWMPHLYTQFAESNRNGLPVMRPLVLEYPNDENTYNLYDQFMLGNHVIIAPIMQPSMTKRVVYLPEGKWVNYWTNEVLEGNQHHLIHADLDVLPIFVKEGTMVAHGDLKQNNMEKDQKITLHYYAGESTESEYVLYEDDGETFSYESGNYMRKTFSVKCENGEIHIHCEEEGSYTPDWKEVEFVAHNGENLKVFLNDTLLDKNSTGNYLLK